MLIPRPKISGVRDIDAVLLAETHSTAGLKAFKVRITTHFPGFIIYFWTQCVVRDAYLKYFDLSIPYYHKKNAAKRLEFKHHVRGIFMTTLYSENLNDVDLEGRREHAPL
jgi:hypothetical protein